MLPGAAGVAVSPREPSQSLKQLHKLLGSRGASHKQPTGPFAATRQPLLMRGAVACGAAEHGFLREIGMTGENLLTEGHEL